MEGVGSPILMAWRYEQAAGEMDTASWTPGQHPLMKLAHTAYLHSGHTDGAGVLTWIMSGQGEGCGVPQCQGWCPGRDPAAPGVEPRSWLDDFYNRAIRQTELPRGIPATGSLALAKQDYDWLLPSTEGPGAVRRRPDVHWGPARAFCPTTARPWASPWTQP